MLRSGTTLLALVLLLSCGRFLFGPRAYGFEEHAALAVWNWRTSGAEEIWHEGFVPLDDMSAIPPKESSAGTTRTGESQTSNCSKNTYC
jgi:hypothetical protein